MTTLPFEHLERAYERLADAIDQAGPEQESLFLAKLALTLAHELGDIAAFERSIAVALTDLAAPPPAAAAR